MTLKTLEKWVPLATVGSFIVAILALVASLFGAYVSYASLQLSRYPIAFQQGRPAAPTGFTAQVVASKSAVNAWEIRALPGLVAILSLFLVAFSIREIVGYLLQRKFKKSLGGELFRVVTATKNAFAGITQQLYESLKQDFVADVDVLVELYVVNLSSRTQYIRDFCANLEIDGKQVAMRRQTTFDAWKLDGRDYEYCLDPDPDGSAFELDNRAETLTPLFVVLPAELGPRKPLQGWIRFTLKGVSPKKLENNRAYTFTIVDSLGVLHTLDRSRKPTDHGEIKTRKKNQTNS